MLSNWPPLKLAELGFAGALLSLSSLAAPALALLLLKLRPSMAEPEADV